MKVLFNLVQDRVANFNVFGKAFTYSLLSFIIAATTSMFVYLMYRLLTGGVNLIY